MRDVRIAALNPSGRRPALSLERSIFDAERPESLRLDDGFPSNPQSKRMRLWRFDQAASQHGQAVREAADAYPMIRIILIEGMAPLLDGT